MRQAQKETVGLNKGAAVPTRVDEKPTLASQGIDKNLAHQARIKGKDASGGVIVTPPEQLPTFDSQGIDKKPD